ncbi:GILT-like protein 1 [Brachionichthys hirsutus]|uniref:GILT-like protein 1 n=1 Tax=Brachionichthys hirsutus TaxID=412623 RepID=UPI003604DB5D
MKAPTLLILVIWFNVQPSSCPHPAGRGRSSVDSALHCGEKPYGQRYNFACQHGEQECLGNMIQTCLLNMTDMAFPIIFCMESSSNVTKAAKSCVDLFAPHLGWDPIIKCVNGDLGNQLMHQNALKTNALVPPHQFVPWVTVNGVHTEELQKEATSSLFTLVCRMFKGARTPACGGSQGGYKSSFLSAEQREDPAAILDALERYFKPAQELLHTTPADIPKESWVKARWRDEWKGAVPSRLHRCIEDPTDVPGQDLPRKERNTLNRLRTGVGRFAATMQKWGPITARHFTRIARAHAHAATSSRV